MSSPQLARFGTRLLIYTGIWLFAALVLEIDLEPEGMTETNLSPIQQRLLLPPCTPILIVVGLAQSASWPAYPKEVAVATGATIFIMHAFFILAGARRDLFCVLVGLQVVLLTVGIVYFVRLSHLPSGG